MKNLIILLLTILIIIISLYYYKNDYEKSQIITNLEAETEANNDYIYDLLRQMELKENQIKTLNNEVARLHNRNKDSYE